MKWPLFDGDRAFDDAWLAFVAGVPDYLRGWLRPEDRTELETQMRGLREAEASARTAPLRAGETERERSMAISDFYGRRADTLRALGSEFIAGRGPLPKPS